MSFGKPGAEAHHAVVGASRAGDDGQSEHEQRVREQRAEDRRLGDDHLAGGEREADDEELRQVAERRLQDAGHGRAEACADRLGADADDPGESGEREAAQTTNVATGSSVA